MFFTNQLAVYAAALWWGSFSTVGFWVVPLLFVKLENKTQAGTFAAQLFTVQVWITLLTSGMLFLCHCLGRRSNRQPYQRFIPLILLVGITTALVQQWWITPHIVARDNHQLWHRLGGITYVVQWLCATVMVWWFSGHHTQKDKN